MCGSIDTGTGTLVRESSWANIRDRTIVRHFDAAQMPGPMAVASTLGNGAAATEGAWRSGGAIALLASSEFDETAQAIKMRAKACQGALKPMANLSGSESSTNPPPHSVTG